MQPVSERAEQIVEALGQVRVRTASRGDGGDRPHSECNRGAVLESIPALDLERMADGVTQVESAPLTRLEWIAATDRELEARAALDDRVAAGFITTKSRRTSILDQPPQYGVADHPGLDALRHSVAAGGQWQGPERGELTEDRD